MSGHEPVRRLRRTVVAIAVVAATAVPVAVAADPGHDRAATPWPGGRWQPDTASYGMVVQSDVPITMSDGVVLYANVGYPSDPATGARADGDFPVLLTQNPYAGPGTQPDSFYVSQGYIFVSADVRGTGRSTSPDGSPLPNLLFSRRDAQDGVELVDWAAHDLDGSDGDVGLTGCSFLGINQIFTAAAVGPDSPVKAIVPACASQGYATYFAGGIPGQNIPLFGASAAIFGPQHLAENTASGNALREEVLAGGPRAYDGDFWQERTTANVAGDIARNGIPALLWSGWSATDGAGALDMYAILQNAAAGRPDFAPMAPDQPVTGRYQIIVGPWGHGQGLDRSIQLEWYDTWLKGQHTGVERTATPMHLYELQTNRWTNAATYPIVSRSTPYSLADGGALSADRAAEGSASLTWGPPDQAGSSTAFTTPPFAAGATIAGPAAVTITASSSNTNVELVATLLDVAPDGTTQPITFGALLGSLRATDDGRSWFDEGGNLVRPSHPFTSDDALVPGVVTQFDVALNPIVWAVLPGHALRLVLTTQPAAGECTSALSSLTPQRPCVLTASQQATLPGGVYTIVLGGPSPSRIDLPLTTAWALPTAPSGPTVTSAGQVEPLVWGSSAPAL